MMGAAYSLRMGPDLSIKTILYGPVKTAAENWIRILDIALFAANHYKTNIKMARTNHGLVGYMPPSKVIVDK